MGSLIQIAIGPLPASWRVIPIRQECIDCAFGPRFSSKEYVPDGAITTLRTTDMDDNGHIDFTHAPRANLDPKRFVSHFLRIGDIVVSRSGTCGIASVFEGYERPVLPGAFLIRLRMRDTVWPQYLRYYLNSPPGRARTALIAEGAIQKNISGTRLQDFQIPLPPLDEQRQIAAVLSAVQRAIERQERLIALTAELKKALMHKLFTEGTRGQPRKPTEIGPVPESWEIVPLGSIAKIGNGSTPKRDNVAYWKGGTIPWLTSGKIHEGRIKMPDQYVTETAKAECHLPLVAAGSLLVAITGEGKTLGNAALVEFDTCVSQHLAYVQFHRADVVPAFLLYFLQRQYAHLRQMSVGAGSTKKALTCGLLKRYAVPVPTRDEQRLIAAAIDAIVVKMNGHERIAECLRALFRTLLHQLMTAQIRVHDLELAELGLEARDAGQVA